MHESHAFLDSLCHSNPHRPKFVIKHRSVNAQLQIEHAGQRIEVPISEILHFASRWERDREQQVAARIEANWIGLDIYPYPLYSVGLDDPDVRDTAWWVE